MRAAGKGVNVARVLRLAGCPVTVVAAGIDDAFQRLAEETRPSLEVEGQRLGSGQRVRINTTITDPSGVTTKINEAGPTLTREQLDVASDLLLASARGAAWVALSGSLPPGAPDDWYAQLITRLARLGARVAVDTSEAALDAVLAGLPGGRFDLIKPNSDELAQLVGGDAAAFEEAAAAGEVPGGCVSVRDGEIVGRGRNRREEKQATASHAEMEAIAQANEHLGTWRLDDCELYVTLEPCPMCAGAILNARIRRVWYGARDEAFGACGGVTNLFMESFPNRPALVGGILGEDCRRVLADFFAGLRGGEKNRPSDLI